MGGFRINNLGTPTAPADAATKGYVDGFLPLTGGTLTGDLALTGAGKAYRLRRSGGALDFDAAGAKLYISNFQNADFTGGQRTYLVLENGAAIAQFVGRWEGRQTPDGTTRNVIDNVTGEAKLGSKNSLTNINFCGQLSVVGSPTTGTWAVGDCVMDSQGAFYVCNGAGTPGSWLGGKEISSIPNTVFSQPTWWMAPAHGTTTTFAPTQNTACFTPLVLQHDAQLTDVVIDVATAEPGAPTIRCGLASSDADGLPGTWLNDFGNFGGTTSVTGNKTLAATPSVYLSAGTRYWLGVVLQGAVGLLQIRGRSGWDPHLPAGLPGAAGSGLNLNSSRTHFTSTGWSGALSGAITLATLIPSGPSCAVRLQ